MFFFNFILTSFFLTGYLIYTFLIASVAELWKAKRCTVRIFKRMILYVSVFEGGIFANVSTPS